MADVLTSEVNAKLAKVSVGVLRVKTGKHGNHTYLM
jgi:hypothetical protein